MAQPPAYYLSEFSNSIFIFSVWDYLNGAIQGKRIPTLPLHLAPQSIHVQNTLKELEPDAINWRSNFPILRKIWANTFTAPLKYNAKDNDSLLTNQQILLKKQAMLYADTQSERISVLEKTITDFFQSDLYTKKEVLAEAFHAYVISIIIPQTYIEYLLHIYPHVQENVPYQNYIAQELMQIISGEIIKSEIRFFDYAFSLLYREAFSGRDFKDNAEIESSFTIIIHYIFHYLQGFAFIDDHDKLIRIGIDSKKIPGLLEKIKDHLPDTIRFKRDMIATRFGAELKSDDRPILMSAVVKALNKPNFGEFLSKKIMETFLFFAAHVAPLYDEKGNLLSSSKTIHTTLNHDIGISLKSTQEKIQQDECRLIVLELNKIRINLGPIAAESETTEISASSSLIIFDDKEHYQACFATAIARYEQNFSRVGHFHIFHSFKKLKECYQLLETLMESDNSAYTLKTIDYVLMSFRGDLSDHSFKTFLLEEILQDHFLMTSLNLEIAASLPTTIEERQKMISLISLKIKDKIPDSDAIKPVFKIGA